MWSCIVRYAFQVCSGKNKNQMDRNMDSLRKKEKNLFDLNKTKVKINFLVISTLNWEMLICPVLNTLAFKQSSLDFFASQFGTTIC